MHIDSEKAVSTVFVLQMFAIALQSPPHEGCCLLCCLCARNLKDGFLISIKQIKPETESACIH